MSAARHKFASLGDAIAALKAIAEPRLLTRFDPVPTESLVIAVNEAAGSDPVNPVPGEHPDRRRNRDLTADVEIDYLYRQLVERGHARQVLSLSGRLYELSVDRVEIEGDDAIYGFVMRLPRDPSASG